MVGVQKTTTKQTKRSGIFYLGTAFILLAQAFWMNELTQIAYSTTDSNFDESYGMPTAAVLSYSELDFIPNECHEHLVHEFPTLSNLLTSGKNSQMGQSGGQWSACTHVEIYGVNFAAFLARHLAFGLQPKTVLEFGCGLGTTSDYLARFVPGGSRVVCVEPEPMLGEVLNVRPFPQRPLQLSMLSFAPEAQACANVLYTSSSSSSTKKKKKSMNFDLVLSLEVAEHIPAIYQPQLIQRLADATYKYLVFAAARPDQKGTGHISESTKSRTWWTEQFENQGLVYLPQLSRAMRRVTASPERAYDLGKNIIVMGRPGVGVDVVEDTIPAVAHDCLFYPKFNMKYRKGEKQFGDEEEDAYILNKKNKNNNTTTIPPYLTLEQPCPFPTDAQMEKRKLWVEGQTQALWPELDLLIRKVKSGQLKCK